MVQAGDILSSLNDNAYKLSSMSFPLMALPSSAQQVNKKIKGGNQLGSAIIRSIGEAAKIGIIWVQVIKLYNHPNF